MRTRYCTLVIILWTVSSLAGSSFVQAQDTSLLSKLNDSMSANGQKVYTTGTFKATHVVNMQTVEGPAKGAMIFLIQHRFGQLNSGSYNFFGLDNATLRLGFDYGITDRLTVGIGRSSYQKTYDGYVKYKLIRQVDGSGSTPVTVSVLDSPVAPGATLAGEKLAVAFAGSPVTASATAAVNGFVASTELR